MSTNVSPVDLKSTVNDPSRQASRLANYLLNQIQDKKTSNVDKLKAVQKLGDLYVKYSLPYELKQKIIKVLVDFFRYFNVNNKDKKIAQDLINLRVAVFEALNKIGEKEPSVRDYVNRYAKNCRKLVEYFKNIGFFEGSYYKPYYLDTYDFSGRRLMPEEIKEKIKSALLHLGRLETPGFFKREPIKKGLDYLQHAHDSKELNLVEDGEQGNKFGEGTREVLVKELMLYAKFSN